MADEEPPLAGRRAKRRCVARKDAVPSAIHYVGYVEDEETPEMIMRKFEELEKVVAAARARKDTAAAATATAATASAMATGGGGAALSMSSAQGDNGCPSTAMLPAAACTAGPWAEYSMRPHPCLDQAASHGLGTAGSTDSQTQQGAQSANASLQCNDDGCPNWRASDFTYAHELRGAPPTSNCVSDMTGLSAVLDASAAAAGGLLEDEQMVLTEESLLEVFRQTSTFNVREALTSNDVYLRPGPGNAAYGYLGGSMAAGSSGCADGAAGDAAGDADGWASDMDGALAWDDSTAGFDGWRGFWSDGEDDPEPKANGGKRRGKGSKTDRRGKGTGSGSDGSGRSGVGGGGGGQAQVVTYINKETGLVTRRRLKVSERIIQQLRLPAPLPPSWGRRVQQYESPPPSPTHAAISISARAALAVTSAGTEADAKSTSMGVEKVKQKGDVRECTNTLDLTSSALCSTAPLQHPASVPLALLNSSSSAAAESTAIADATGVDTTHTGLAPCCYREVQDIASCCNNLTKQYQCVLINSGWLRQHGGCGGGTTVAAAAAGAWPEPLGGAVDCNEADLLRCFAALPLHRLCPVGFLFVWGSKGLLQPLMRHICAAGYNYVENLTWVFMQRNNSVLRLPARYACRSHATLLIFRREGEGKHIELRHQRNADAVLDCVRESEGREWEVPPEVYSTIETLLPSGAGSFLELWGARHVTRPGWDHVIQIP